MLLKEPFFIGEEHFMSQGIDWKSQYEQHTRKLRELNQIFLKLSQSRHIDDGNLEEALREIVKSATEALGIERSSIWTYNEDKTAIVCRALYIRAENKFYEGITLFKKDFPGYFNYLAEARSLAAHDAHTDPNTCEFSEVYLKPLGINSMLDAPVRIKGEMAGVICNEHVGPIHTWTEEEQSLAGNLADLVSRTYTAYFRRLAQEEVQRLNRNLEQLVEAKTRDIKAMFQVIEQGMLTVNGLGQVDPEFSRYTQGLFPGKSISGALVVELLWPKGNSNSEMRAKVEGFLHEVVGETAMQWDMNSQILPRRVELARAGSLNQILDLDWQPMYNPRTGLCEKVFLAIRDVTTLLKLEKEAKEKGTQLNLMDRILTRGAHSLEGFLDNCFEIIKVSRAQLSSPKGVELSLLYRYLHTLKGNARTYGFSELARAVHACENVISTAIAQPGAPLDLQLLEIHLAGIGQNLAQIQTCYRKLAAFGKGMNQSGSRESLRELFQTTLEAQLPCALALDKALPTLVWKGDEMFLKPNHVLPIQSCLVHVLTNSIQHGLETLGDRQKVGKSTQGSITVEIHKNENGFKIRLQDDGKGYDLVKLKARGSLLKGTSSESQTALISPKEVLNLTFLAGLSTLESATEFSGRGVGMDAVKASIQELGGQVELLPLGKTDSNGFCPGVLEFQLPEGLFEPLSVVKVA